MEFGRRVFQQTVGITIGTNWAPLLHDLFLYSQEQNLFRVSYEITKRNFPDRLILLFAVSMMFCHWTTDSNKSAPYLHLFLEIHHEGKLVSKIYDNWDDFNFTFVNFPYWCGNIPAFLVYRFYVSQLMRYFCVCSKYQDFLKRAVLYPVVL